MRHTHRVYHNRWHTRLTQWADDHDPEHIHRIGHRVEDPWTTGLIPVRDSHIHADADGHVTSDALAMIRQGAVDVLRPAS